MASAATVFSAFTGLGGLDLGLESAGFGSVGCVELDPVARRSLKANRGDDWPLHTQGDLVEVAETIRPRDLGMRKRELTLLAGAPPCQPYSKAAMWARSAWNGLADPQAAPLFPFLDLVERLQPAAVLMENVPGFVRGTHSALEFISSCFEQINEVAGTNYRAQAAVLDMADYGVPQRRHRAIVVAFRDGQVMQWPAATFVNRPVRAWDALRDLHLDPDELPVAFGKWADLLPSIPEGSNYLFHTPRGGGRPLFGYRTRYWSFLLKLAKNQPAWTLPAQPGPSTGPFHWDSRPLHFKEMLRLQTFPADWIVEGSRREQVRQVGNATPPLIGELLGRSVMATLGLESPTGRPVHAISRAREVPPAKRRAPVPPRFADLELDHAAHPGAGLGPRPRLDRPS